MFLDTRPPAPPPPRARPPQRVVGEPVGTPKASARCGIVRRFISSGGPDRRGAFQQRDVPGPPAAPCTASSISASVAMPVDMMIGFPWGRFLDQGQVDQFERGDLVGRHVDGLEEIDRRGVERRRETVQSQLVGDLLQLRLPLPRGVGFLVEMVERRPAHSFLQPRGSTVGRCRRVIVSAV